MRIPTGVHRRTYAHDTHTGTHRHTQAIRTRYAHTGTPTRLTRTGAHTGVAKNFYGSIPCYHWATAVYAKKYEKKFKKLLTMV